MTTTHFTSPKKNLLHEIARRADVSTATVSRVLSGATKGTYGKIAKRNEIIRQIADSLNYRPSFHARTFQRRKTGSVALLYVSHRPHIGAVYATMITAAMEALLEQGYHLTLWGLKPDDVQKSDLLLDRRFDGCIVHHELSPVLREAIDRAALPAVMLNTADDESLPCVVPDDRGAAARLTRHLLDLGHRRVRMVNLDSGQWAAREREAGYRQAMSAAGLEADMKYLQWQQSPDPAVLGLDEAQRPTGIVFYSATAAAESVNLLAETGWSVPRDLSVVTFGPNGAVAYTRPAITTMEVPFDEVGRAGATLLLEQIAAFEDAPEDAPTPRHAARQVVVPLSFIRRRSDAAPGAAADERSGS